MKVTKIALWSVDLTSHETYHMAEGKTCATVKTHILCLETDTGLKGWGEVCPIPHYLPAFANGVPGAVIEMGPEILGISRLCCTNRGLNALPLSADRLILRAL
ncbi:hypothetical protein [Ruegeria sp. EL01]|uniref:hypothetical protein n=1 Tax=Ruegeria sp. EL01 TaxID=2107578 RepID=UPI0020B1407B|nr:hypothetical protein [Ruegeria sp. EL01]